MYDVISTNVIRQSLKAANLPTPKRITRLDRLERPDGATIVAYTTSFDRKEMEAALIELWMIEGEATSTYKDMLQSAFSDDVHVIFAFIDTDPSLVRVYFTTRLRKRGGNGEM